MSNPLKLYVHKKTTRYLDYGSHLETVTGIAWSTDGENPQGFERGRTVADALARMAEFPGVEIVEGCPVERSFDMNPHGLI